MNLKAKYLSVAAATAVILPGLSGCGGAGAGKNPDLNTTFTDALSKGQYAKAATAFPQHLDINATVGYGQLPAGQKGNVWAVPTTDPVNNYAAYDYVSVKSEPGMIDERETTFYVADVGGDTKTIAVSADRFTNTGFVDKPIFDKPAAEQEVAAKAMAAQLNVPYYSGASSARHQAWVGYVESGVTLGMFDQLMAGLNDALKEAKRQQPAAIGNFEFSDQPYNGTKGWKSISPFEAEYFVGDGKSVEIQVFYGGSPPALVIKDSSESRRFNSSPFTTAMVGLAAVAEFKVRNVNEGNELALAAANSNRKADNQRRTPSGMPMP